MNVDNYWDRVEEQSVRRYIANYTALDTWIESKPAVRRLAGFMNYGYRRGHRFVPERAEKALLLRALQYSRRRNPMPRNVLEIGCGRGGNLALLERIFPDAHVCGLDLTIENLLAASTRTRRSNNLMNGDSQAFPIRSRSVDLIVCMESAHGYASITTFLAEAARALADDGLLVVADFAPSEVWPEIVSAATSLGNCRLLAYEEITDGVVSARRHAGRFTPLLARSPLPQPLRSFMALPGSPMFAAFDSRQLEYRVATFTRPSPSRVEFTRSDALELMGELTGPDLGR